MSNYLSKLYEYNKTLLDYNDFGFIFSELKQEYLKTKIKKLCDSKILTRLSKWLFYLTSKWYDNFEIPTKLYSPSYISFHSALYYHKMIFQLPYWISFAYKRNVEKTFWNEYIYSKRIKESVLYNTTWIISSWNFSIASKERAFLDTLYIYPDIYIDNLSNLDREVVIKMSSIYQNKAFEKKVILYFNENKKWAQ